MTWIWLVPGGVAWVLLTLLLLWLKKAAAEELSTRIGKFPLAAVTIAARLLPRDRRDDYRDEWASDAEQLIADTDGKPLTRIIKNIGFAISLTARARSLRRLVRPAAAVPISTAKKRGHVFLSGVVDVELTPAERNRRHRALFELTELLRQAEEVPTFPIKVRIDNTDYRVDRRGDDFDVHLLPRRE